MKDFNGRVAWARALAEEFDAMPSPLNQYESANVSAILHAEAVR